MQENTDNFIGKTFKSLTVIGWDGERRNGAKYYTLFCSVCSNDPELFGDGIFKATKHCLTQGKIPCGCATHPRWTDNQYRIRLKRVCDSKGYLIRGISEDFVGGNTQVKLECTHDGNVWEVSYKHILEGNSCRKCANLSKRKSDESQIEKFMKTGSFPEGTRFFRTNRKDMSGKSYWKYFCPVCSNDVFVQEGLCSGLFEMQESNLIKGSMRCRCSDKIFWTKEQREFQIKGALSSTNKYKFLGWSSTYKNSYTIVRIECDIHG